VRPGQLRSAISHLYHVTAPGQSTAHFKKATIPQIVSGPYQSHADAMQAIWALYTAGLPLRDIVLVLLSMQPTSASTYHTPRPDAEPFDAQT
jgi:hypothetical protein